jgi:hypothetical protein
MTMPRYTLVPLLAVVLAIGCQSQAQPSTAQQPSQAAAAKPQPQPQDADLRALVELARKDVQFEKQAIVAENMDFTDAEAAAFWPVYRRYEAELAQINDRRIELIRKFLPQAQQLSEADARDLAKQSFDIEQQRTELKRKSFDELQKVIPAAKAARFVQIENVVNMLVDLRVAAAMPLIKAEPAKTAP